MVNELNFHNNAVMLTLSAHISLSRCKQVADHMRSSDRLQMLQDEVRRHVIVLLTGDEL